MTPLRCNQSPARSLLLIGWDGADWKVASPLIDRGEMPQLANLVEHGASGPLASYPPYLSPMLWNSIATGKYPHQHGIAGFATADPQTGRLVPMASTQRRCKAVWNILSEQGLTAHVICWFASHPAENVTGVCVTEAFPRPVPKGASWPLPAGAVHPSGLAAEFAELRVRPEEVDPAILELFVPRASEIDLSKDRRLEQLAVRLAELYSVHNAAIAALDRGPCDFLAVYYHFIDWVGHDFMDFHPPRRPHVPEREFDWYADVVNSAYRLQDLLLRDLLAHAGADTTAVICSDHGFHSDARRPLRVPQVSAGIAIWHRAQGLFAAAGPGIARDALVPGATLLDVAPTLLHLLGLPAGADMDGRVLTAALAPGSPAPRTLPSWERVPGSHPRPRHLTALSTDDQAALLEQFAALGYVDLAPHGPEAPAASNDRDNRWNLAMSLRHAGRDESAWTLLDALHLDCPEDPRYAYHLALVQLALGLTAEAATTAETIADFTPGISQGHLLLADLAIARGDASVALAQLDAAECAGALTSHLRRGQALLQLGRAPEAAAAFRSAIEADHEDPSAWLGLAQTLLRAGQSPDAETCAREALALAPTMAAAHLTLGRALAVQHQVADARTAFTRAAELNPRLAAAREALARLQGAPFQQVDVDFSTLTEAVDRLRATSAARRTELARIQAARRRGTRPVDRFDPPLPKHGADSPAAPTTAGQTFVIVSGLPRSGTSLMMQMLARGGLPPMTDGQRAADEHNSEGYYEWEEAKNLPRDHSLIVQAAGKVVKLVSPLLAHLPTSYRYKIIFMLRPPAEIARSQHKMRTANPRLADETSGPVCEQTASETTLGPAQPPPSPDTMEPRLASHQQEALALLRAAPNIEVLTVDYPRLVAAPAAEVARVAAFLGRALLPAPELMPAAVQPKLYRERESPP